MSNKHIEVEPSPCQANSSTVSAKRRSALLPDCFTGDPDLQWCDWLDDFELHAEVNEWDDTQRRQYLALWLKGYPRELYRSLTATKKSSYDSLKSALTSHFEPLVQTEFCFTTRSSGQEPTGMTSNFSSSPWHFAHWLPALFQKWCLCKEICCRVINSSMA